MAVPTRGRMMSMSELEEETKKALRQNPLGLPGRPAVLLVDGKSTLVEPFGGIVELSPDLQLWERQPKEPDRAWAMFRVYRDMRPEIRSRDGAYRLLRMSLGQLGVEKRISPTMSMGMTAASKRWRWEERARAWDSYEDAQIQKELINRRVRARVETANLGRELRQKAAQAASVIQSITLETVVIDGQSRKVIRSNLSVNDIVRLAQAGATLERAALGMDSSGPVPGLEIKVNVGVVPPSDEDIIQRSAEILSARSQLIDAEAESQNR